MNPDFSDILSAFSAEHVKFLLVGAYALAVHGLSRATGDLDIWIEASPDNATRVMRALAHFGAPLEQLHPEELQTEDLIFQIGVIPNRIDVLTSLDGVSFEDAWNHRLETQLGILTVPVISRTHLIMNKRASGRPKDLADLAWLEATE